MADARVHTEFTGDATGAEAAATQAKNAAEGVKQKNEEQNASFVEGTKKSIGAFTSFLGAITAAVGAATLFYTLGQKIRETWIEFFKTGTERAAEFALTLGNEPVANLNKTREKISELEQQLDVFSAGGMKQVLLELQGVSQASIEEELKGLRQTEQANINQIEAIALRKKDAAAKVEAEQQRLIAETQQKEQLAAEQAEAAEQTRQREEAERQQRDAFDRQRELERAMIESARRIGEAMTDALLEPLKEAIRQNQAFLQQQQQSIETTLGNFAATINATSEEPGWGEG